MVADFGIAGHRALASSGDRHSRPVFDRHAGVHGSRAGRSVTRGVDHRADLYALGVVAYEVLAGHPPFAGSTVAAIVTAALTQPAPSLADSRPACPPRLVALVAALLEKDPARRPQTATSVRDPPSVCPRRVVRIATCGAATAATARRYAQRSGRDGSHCGGGAHRVGGIRGEGRSAHWHRQRRRPRPQPRPRDRSLSFRSGTSTGTRRPTISATA